jgi:hypothetical protein
LSEGTRAAGLRIGSRGWDHESWSPGFYPEDLPPEWRLTYYANAFRAVLIPGERLAVSEPAEVARWAADVDPGFAFYAELDPAGGDAALDGWIERLDPLVDLLAGLVLTPACGGLSASRIASLAGRWPLAWLETPGDRIQAAGGPGAQRVWCPGRHGGGCVGLLDGEPRGPRELRRVIEEFRAASPGCPDALLCFPGTPGSLREMEQARLIVSLLGG